MPLLHKLPLEIAKGAENKRLIRTISTETLPIRQTANLLKPVISKDVIKSVKTMMYRTRSFSSDMVKMNLLSQSSHILQSELSSRTSSFSISNSSSTKSDTPSIPHIPPDIFLYFKNIHISSLKDMINNEKDTLNFDFYKSEKYDIIKERKAFKKNFMKYSNNIFNEIKWNNILVTGEYILKCLNVIEKSMNSINICIYGLNHENSKNKIEELIKYFRETLHSYHPYIIITSHVISIISDFPIKRINIIVYSFINKDEIIFSHDICVNQIGYDGNEIYCSENNIKCILNRTIIYNPNIKRKKKYCYLLLNYIENGFSINFRDMNLTLNHLIYHKRINLDLNKCKSIIELLYFIKMNVKSEDEMKEIKERIDLHLFNALLYDKSIPYKEKVKSKDIMEYITSKYKIEYQLVKSVKILLDERNKNVYLLQND